MSVSGILVELEGVVVLLRDCLLATTGVEIVHNWLNILFLLLRLLGGKGVVSLQVLLFLEVSLKVLKALPHLALLQFLPINSPAVVSVRLSRWWLLLLSS